MRNVRGQVSERAHELRLAALAVLMAASTAAALFIENAQPGYEGTVKFEAETFDARTDGFYGTPPSIRAWTVVPDERGGFPALYASAYGGTYVQVRPDAAALNAGDTPFDDGPTITYEIQILTTGTYEVLTRFSGHDANSDSVWVRVREGSGYFRLAAPGPGFRDADFTDSWHSGAESAHGGAAGDTIRYALAPGLYHLDYAMRADGLALDQILLTRNVAFIGAGDANKLPIPLSVPEPAAAALLLFGTVIGLRRRASRRWCSCS